MGQIELVAGHDEGHFLLDEALAFVGGQGLGGVQHREPGHLADLVDLRANAGKAGASIPSVTFRHARTEASRLNERPR